MLVSIIYYSGTGNTEKMAELIAEGVREKGSTANVVNVTGATAEDIQNADIVLLGCPSLGAEELDHDVFEPYLENNMDLLRNKKVSLFGSYGWGDGQWMREWNDNMVSQGIEIFVSPLIVNETPVGDSAETCKQFGHSVVEAL